MSGSPPLPIRCAPRAPSTALPTTPTTWSSRASRTGHGSSPSFGLDKRRQRRRRSTRHAVRDPGGNGSEKLGSHGSENRHRKVDLPSKVLNEGNLRALPVFPLQKGRSKRFQSK